MNNKDTKRLDIKEFREKGYLQEVNRRFLHPLGLALEIVIDKNGSETLGGIWDYRDDNEEIFYDIANSDLKRKEKFKKNKDFIDKEFETRKFKREKILVFNIEPI